MKYYAFQQLLIKVILSFFSLGIPLSIGAQNSVGLITIQPDKIAPGYNLLYPHNQANVYLLNNCGEIVHIWEDDAHFRPGNMAYLMPNGNLYKTKRPSELTMPAIGAGGAGGIIELRDWENRLLWQTTLMDSLVRAHHDIAPLPNGNVLILSWEKKTLPEIVAAGRDTSTFSEQELWPDFIIDVNPFQDSIVWEWHTWDHLVQEFDETKPNFGKVVEHPELIHLNYDLEELGGKPDWMHTNAIDYNAELDQILLSVPFFNEIWIIDHSTTTFEAKGHTGGKSGKGGDLLFRWGNPKVYQQGAATEQQLFFQHDANWVKNLDRDEYSIAVFNNRIAADRSVVNILNPSFDSSNSRYLINENAQFLPETFTKTIEHPIPEKMFSSGLSSAQLLPNGNALICVGRQGYSFEITPEDKIVWEYVTPLRAGNPISQGTQLALNDNITFRIKRYPLTYPPFANKNLSILGKIEIDENSLCDSFLVSIEESLETKGVKIYPTPTRQNLTIEFQVAKIRTINLFNMMGQQVLSDSSNDIKVNLDLSSLSTGLYFLKINGQLIAQKIYLTNN